MAGEIKVEGLKELSEKLKKLGAVAGPKILRKALRASAKPVISAAKANIPQGVDAHYVGRNMKKGRSGFRVFPGYAKRSIKAVVKLSSDKSSGSVLTGVKSTAFYAVQFVELGTSRFSAKPWLVPAMESTQQQQVDALGAVLKREIDKVAR